MSPKGRTTHSQGRKCKENSYLLSRNQKNKLLAPSTSCLPGNEKKKQNLGDSRSHYPAAAVTGRPRKDPIQDLDDDDDATHWRDEAFASSDWYFSLDRRLKARYGRALARSRAGKKHSRLLSYSFFFHLIQAKAAGSQSVPVNRKRL